ncbi:MAG: hypothetical protein EXR11_08240 [Rhodospirillaceae bacterium]|nr:hypothetical protein [Rhodospirillaceae bacterium]
MSLQITRALNLICGLTERHFYLLGDQLTATDITAAAVLAPIARKEGWAWAGQAWPPMSMVAGRSSLAVHRGAAWVRTLYEHHGKRAAMIPASSRAWLP